MSKGGRPRKQNAPRTDKGRLSRAGQRRDIEPTPELKMRRIEILGLYDRAAGAVEPIEIMFNRRISELERPPGPDDRLEDRAIVDRRRDVAAVFINLSRHVWGLHDASSDARYRNLVPPSETAEDVDHQRPRVTDIRSPDQRAEDVRAKHEAMMRVVRRGPRGGIREWVLRQVGVYGHSLARLEPNPSKRERLRMHLLDALDALADDRDVRRAVDEIRATWTQRRAAA